MGRPKIDLTGQKFGRLLSKIQQSRQVVGKQFIENVNVIVVIFVLLDMINL